MTNLYTDLIQPEINKYLVYCDRELDRHSYTYCRVYLRRPIGPFGTGFYFNYIIFDTESVNPIEITGSIPYYIPKPAPSGVEPGSVEENEAIDYQANVWITNPDLQTLEPVLNEHFPSEEVSYDQAIGTDGYGVDLTPYWNLTVTVTSQVIP
jgi:hypothetical protein